MTCGYSPVVILEVIILGVSILVYTIWVGSRPLKESAMPVAGSNSMLIEQQCLLEEEKNGVEKRALQWGVRRSHKSEGRWIAGFSDLPISGGEKELETLRRRSEQENGIR